MRGSARHEYGFALLGRYGRKVKVLEPVHRHRRNLPPILERCGGDAFSRAVTTVRQIIRVLIDEHVARQRTKRLFRGLLTAIGMDKIQNPALDTTRVIHHISHCIAPVNIQYQPALSFIVRRSASPIRRIGCWNIHGRRRTMLRHQIRKSDEKRIENDGAEYTDHDVVAKEHACAAGQA